MENKNAELLLSLDLPESFSVVFARIEEGISEQTHAQVEIASVRDLDLSEVLEAPAVLQLQIDHEVARQWTFRVDEIDFIGDIEGSFRYRVHLRPEFWLLRYTTSTRKYRNMSSKDIISKILGEHGVKHAWQIQREPEKRKYCVQYRETNLAFIMRLLEFEAIYFTFDPDGTLVFADNSPSSDVVAGRVAYDLIESAGAMVWHHTGLFKVGKGRQVASGKATVNDYNWKTPSLKLIESQAADEDAELEIYDYPVGYRRSDQGSRLAQQRLEAYRVPATYLVGEGNVQSFQPARIFAFTGNAQPRFGGEYLIQKITHRFWNRKYDEQQEGGAGFSYRNAFHAIPKDVPYRPPLVTPHPHIEGCHTAMVRGPEGEEIHTDEHGRFRMQWHWDREAVGTDEDSRWVRNTQETATGMVLARVGWEQSMAYINGDPDRPFGFARNINGVMVPEYGQPANKTRMTIKTPSYPSTGGYSGYNELRLEDVAGKMTFDWHAQKDLVGDVKNDRKENVGVDETHKVGQNMSHQVENDQDVTIGANYIVKVGGMAPLTVDGNRTKTVSGNEELDIGSNTNASCQSNDTETVTGDRKTKAGADDAGTISRTVEEDFTRTVKGSQTITAKGNIQCIIEDTFTETIKGSMIVKTDDGSIGGTVTGLMTSNVTGSVIRIAKKGMGYSAKNSDLSVTGPAIFKSDEQITVNGDYIELGSTSMIHLQSGGNAFTMLPGGILVKGQMKLNAANLIKVTGNSDNITK